jgi:hypothetical protein
VKKQNFHENADLAGTDFLTATTSLKNAEPNLRAVGQDKSTLKNTDARDPHDYIHKPGTVENPKEEIARIDADLRHMLKRLDEAEGLIRQRREQVLALLA